MRLLLNDEFAPITSEIGFLDQNLPDVVKAYSDWQGELQAKRGVSLSVRPVPGSLPNALSSLLPLTSVERRRALFVPTQSNWTAYFDNGHQGTDAFPPMSFLAQKLGCRAIKVVAILDSKASSSERGRGRFGAVKFVLYGPHKTDWLNVVRVVGVSNQDGKWEFENFGPLLPFENSERYASKIVRERFSFEDLSACLKNLGIRFFEDDFYSSSTLDAIRVERIGFQHKNVKEYSLEDVRATF